ncbi:hypothetical protein ACG9H4_18720, partial [Acinetobacter baumannii]|uniref:hypothetical protein n=1 Tax=Acinetobacter baumannii TaxID=470 RepID=UPI003AF93672
NILDCVVDVTTPDVIVKFIKSIKELVNLKADSVVLVTYRTGLAKFVKQIVGVVGFVASIVGIISPFLPQG